MNKIILLILVSMISSQFLTAQTNSPNIFNPRISVRLGSGTMSLLSLDEYHLGKRFERKALPPIFVSVERPFSRHWSVGTYLGYEFERHSGTLMDFSGPTHLWVAGVNLNIHAFPHATHSWYNPFVGISTYYYSKFPFNPQKHLIIPSFRVGSDFYLNESWGLGLVAGVQTSLLEFYVIYTL